MFSSAWLKYSAKALIIFWLVTMASGCPSFLCQKALSSWSTGIASARFWNIFSRVCFIFLGAVDCLFAEVVDVGVYHMQ